MKTKSPIEKLAEHYARGVDIVNGDDGPTRDDEIAAWTDTLRDTAEAFGPQFAVNLFPLGAIDADEWRILADRRDVASLIENHRDGWSSTAAGGKWRLIGEPPPDVMMAVRVDRLKNLIDSARQGLCSLEKKTDRPQREAPPKKRGRPKMAESWDERSQRWYSEIHKRPRGTTKTHAAEIIRVRELENGRDIKVSSILSAERAKERARKARLAPAL